VKRQTLILVVIGVVLFVAGGALAFATVEKGNKNKAPTVASTVSTPVVVATAAIPAGTTGQQMVSEGLVTLQSIPVKNYLATDLTSLTSLNDVQLTSSIAKGHSIETTQLAASTSAISVPAHMDAITVTLTGVDGLAGYLQPGSRVDVYANVTKASQTQTGAWVPSGLTLPCTELTMTNIEVLDVSSTTPALSQTGRTVSGVVSGAGRTIPTTETILLAVTPAQSQTISFFTQNETVSVVQTQKDTSPPMIGQCNGTGQYSNFPS
jgi:Flp pilus assembly protein CpaB